MRVIREKPCQRLSYRVTAPFYVAADGLPEVRVRDWSVRGVGVESKDWRPQVGSETELRCRLPFQGFDIAFKTTARVVRVDEATDVVGLEHLEIEERATDLMTHFIEDLIRGKASEVDETIARIDIPVTPISRKPDPNPLGEIPVRRWPAQTIFFVFLYFTLGLAVLLYTTLTLYANFWRLEVRTALIVAPVEVSYALGPSHLGDVLVEPGQSVRRGELVALVEDRLIERRIALARRAESSSGELEALLERRDRLHVRAPFDGVVRVVHRPPLATLNQADPIITFERPRDMEIEAYVTQEEANALRIGDEAVIVIGSVGETVIGRVVDIDRESLALEPNEGRLRWRTADDRSVLVTVVADTPLSEVHEQVRSGLPVVVSFQQRANSGAARIIVEVWMLASRLAEAAIPTLYVAGAAEPIEPSGP